jgi:hypothetical protein
MTLGKQNIAPEVSEEEKRAAIMRRMNDAKFEAEDSLVLLPQDAVDAVAKWAEEWYHDTGYKRLGEILVARGKALKQA